MSENKAWNSCHKFSQEDQSQEHRILQNRRKDSADFQPEIMTVYLFSTYSNSIKEERSSQRILFFYMLCWQLHFHISFVTDQFQHPWTSTAGGEATKQAKDDDDGSCANKNIWRIGARVWGQGEIGFQTNFPPYTHRQQDHSCELKKAKALQQKTKNCCSQWFRPPVQTLP